MPTEHSDTIVRCYFTADNESVVTNTRPSMVEIYFARTKDLIDDFPGIIKFIDKEDKLRADRFHFEEDRMTYLICHTLLRIILAWKLKTDPQTLQIVYNKNKKPLLKGDPLFFNLSHTREAFAFAISGETTVGIDLENINRNIDINSIINSFFSMRERDYILEIPHETTDRFFLLWTRKEALLKSIGTGIISNLSHVEVLRQDNVLTEEVFDLSSFNEYFIYSRRILSYYLSLAVTQSTGVKFHRLNSIDTGGHNDLISYVQSLK